MNKEIKKLLDFIHINVSQIQNLELSESSDWEENLYNIDYIDESLDLIPKNLENKTIKIIYKNLKKEIRLKRKDIISCNNITNNDIKEFKKNLT